MKYITPILALLISCGTDPSITVVEQTEAPKEEASLDGYYPLPNNGYLELITLNDGRVLIYGAQLVRTINFDEGFAYHPPITAGPHVLKADGTIRGAYNYTYSSTTHDVERDGTTSNVTGSRRTEYVLKLVGDKLSVNLIIRASTSIISAIHVDRTIISE